MSLGTFFAVSIVIGVAGGWLASMYVKEDGRGLGWDLALGVAGSIAGTVVAWTLGDAGTLSLAIAATMGTAVGLGAQRKFWAGTPVRVPLRARR